MALYRSEGEWQSSKPRLNGEGGDLMRHFYF
jgi:hypothetical protein